MACVPLTCATGCKTPLTEHGLPDATIGLEPIEAWRTQHPDAIHRYAKIDRVANVMRPCMESLV